MWPEGALEEVAAAERDLEQRYGKRLGDAADPLLVSVRSGAPFSMPGMMDTVLNLGLNDESVRGLIAQTDNPRFAWDSYRRFIQMFSDVVLGVDADLFENALTARRLLAGVRTDAELSAEDLEALVGEFKAIFSDHVSAEDHPELVVDGAVAFPADPALQLRLAIQAVFGSWMNERAILYRQRNGIPDDLGTAVNVQVMVFGNKGDTSATGVAFTRNPADGTREFYGDFLVNAQGEDVVAGIRNTEPISDLASKPGLESAGAELERYFSVLENHYRDMCDIEFTIEQGSLWMLQTRVGKRTAGAALRIAIDMVGEGLITREEAVSRIDPAQLDQLLHPQFDTAARPDVIARGLNASPGAAVGAIVFSSDDAVERAQRGEPVILVRWETNPDDLKGMVAAEGILTSHWRQDEPCGRHRPRHGDAVRLRRRGLPHRRSRQGGPHRRQRPRAARGGRHLHRRGNGRRGGGRGAARLRGADGRPRDHPRLGRRHPPRPGRGPSRARPRQRRQPRGLRAWRSSSARRRSACAGPSTCSWASGSPSSRPSS